MGLAQDLITKNPCDFCKPPKRVKTPINALPREERTRMLELARRAQPAPLGIAIELALTTGMRRGEICAPRWSDLSDDGTITVSHALGNGDDGFYVKEPKTSSSLRTIPLTRRTFDMLRLLRADTVRIANEFALPFGDPYILGTQKSLPYNPTQLGKDFSAFCKMNGFKRTAVSKVEESFDAEMSGYGDAIMDNVIGASKHREPAITFSVDQLKAMLAAAEEREAGHGRL